VGDNRMADVKISDQALKPNLLADLKPRTHASETGARNRR